MSLISRALQRLTAPSPNGLEKIGALDLSQKNTGLTGPSALTLGYSSVSLPSATAVDTGVDSLVGTHNTHEIVAAAVGIRAMTAREPRLIVERRDSQGEWQEQVGHPFTALWAMPSERASGHDLIERMVMSFDVVGNTYIEVVRSNAGLPVELHVLDPTKLTPKYRTNPDGSKVVDFWEWRDGSYRTTIDPDDLLVRSGWHMGGHTSLLSKVMGSVDLDRAQTEFARAFFANGGVPSGLIKVHSTTLSEAEAYQIRRQWQLKYGRALGRQHEVAVLDENASYEKIGMSLEGLDNEGLRAVSEARICMTFGVPPLIIYTYVGLLRATYSNLKEAWASFWDATMSPLLTSWAGWLAVSLLTEFEDTEALRQGRVRLRWDFSDVGWLADDVDAKHERVRQDFLAGLTTLNEARSELGYGDWEPVGGPGDFNPHLIALLLKYAKPEALPLLERLFPIAEGVGAEIALPEPVAPDEEEDTEAPEGVPEGLEAALSSYGGPDSQKAFAWRSGPLADLVDMTATDIQPYLRDQYELAADWVERNKSAQWVEQMPLDDGGVLRNLLRFRWVSALQMGHGAASEQVGIELAFDLANPAVADAVVDAAKRVTGVADTTRDEIRAVLRTATREGWGVDETAYQLRQAGVTRSPVRARLIANTELNFLHTRGALMGYEESGVVARVEWLVTDPCPLCQPLANTSQPLGKAFSTGDWSGYPPRHPNCRCALAPIVSQ